MGWTHVNEGISSPLHPRRIRHERRGTLSLQRHTDRAPQKGGTLSVVPPGAGPSRVKRGPMVTPDTPLQGAVTHGTHLQGDL